MSSPKFFSAPESVYTAVTLDDSQRAVLALEAHESAAVLGAPGSGKTATLIEFVAERVESKKLSAAGLLVLAPARLAANSLRLALAERLHIATNGPLARTPMSVAFSLAADGAFARGVEPPRMLTGAEHDQLLADLLSDPFVSALWAPTLEHEVVQSQTFRTELRDLLARCIESGIDAAELARRGAASQRPEWVAAATFWHGPLENALAFNRVNDFDAATLMRQAAVALSDPTVMSEVKLVVVDDAQELTRGAINLLRAFAQRSVPVVIFGDPDTAATTFRGATPAILGDFATQIAPGAKTLALTTVHRHNENIRRTLDKLTPHIGTALAVGHRSARSAEGAPDSNVVFVERDSFNAEIEAVGRLVRERHVYESVPFSKMAVVVRTGSLVPDVARVLTAGEVPTRTLASDNNLRDKSITRDLLHLISVGLNHSVLTTSLVHELLTSPLTGLSVIEVRRLRQVLRHAEIMSDQPRRGDELLCAEVLTPGGFSDINTPAAEKAARLASTIARLTTMATSGASVEELLWEAWSSAPVSKSWPKESRAGGILGQEANRNLDAVLELFTMAKRAVEREPDRPAADFVASVLRAELPEDTLAAQSSSDAVLVCTPAAVIGAEYDTVAVVAVQEGTWPNLRLRGSLLHAPAITDEELPTDDQRQQVRSDELRMFALSVSRASRLLIVSGVSGAEQLVSPFGRYIEALATLPGGDVNESSQRSTYPLTLRGIVGHQRRVLTSAITEHGRESVQARAAAAALAQLAAHEVPGASTRSWYGTRGVSTPLPVAVLDGDNPESIYVSPSRLEKWQDNELAWFLSATVGYEGSASTGIGTLLHAVFEHAAAQPTDEKFDGESLWQAISPRWNELEFEAVWEGDKEQRRVRGMCDSLAQYLNEFAASGKRVVGVESSFKIDVGKGVLQGRADRLESGPDGIEVIDLKSSKTPKSDSYAKTNMQLACYQYAVVSGGFKIIDGVALEPDRDNPADQGPFEPQKTAGARLLYLNNVTKSGFNHKLASQPALATGDQSDPEVLSVEGMRAILESAIEGMASGRYSTTVYTREVDGDYNSSWSNRIHTIRAVSS
jgi:superfamily I DNA/RNA helicase/RecB family exonuclease